MSFSYSAGDACTVLEVLMVIMRTSVNLAEAQF